MFGQFKILVPLGRGETKSYLARHPAFDRTIMLHLLPNPDSSERTLLTGYLERISPEGRKLLLDRGELDGAAYLVTATIEDFRSLREWLEKVTLPVPLPVSPVTTAAPTPPPEAASPPGEFTRLFRAAPPAKVDPPPPPQTTTGPGEFTRMFAGPQPTAEAPSAGIANVPPPGPPQPKKPGAFTNLFMALSDQGAQAPPQPIPAPPPAQPRQAGGFTSLFQAPVQQPRGPEGSAPSSQGEGEFTRTFGQSTTAPPAQVPEPAPPVPAPPPAKAASSNQPIVLILAALLVVALSLIAYFALQR